MDIKQRHPLNSYHVFFLVQSSIFGFGLLSLPHTLSSLGYSQWLMPLFFGALASVSIFFIVKLNALFPDLHLFEIQEKLFGVTVASFLQFAWLLFFLTSVYDAVNNYLRLVEFMLLPNQTTFMLYIVMVVLQVFIVKGGIKSIARFSILAFPVIIIMMIFLSWGLKEGYATHLVPTFTFNTRDFWDAVKPAYSSFLGFELLLLYYHYVQKKEYVMKMTLGGLWTTALFYLIALISSTMYFSEWQLKNVHFSVLKLFQVVELSFVERVDTLSVSLWSIQIISTASIYLWAIQKSIDHFRNKESPYHLYIIAALIVALKLIPIGEERTEQLQQLNSYIGYALSVFPILLYPLAKLHVRRGKHEQVD